MKTCPKCKKQYESGNFCENCENEDGTPVKLEEEKVSCPQCGREYAVGTKFCSECGVRLGTAGAGTSSGSGISMGDKNMISGDVIGHKESYNVSGNATIIKNEDETKKTAKCHICGSIVQKIHGYDCPDCGQFTCGDCFDKAHGVCNGCVEKKVKLNEENYKAKVIESLSDDNRIDAEEFKQLHELQERYGISDYRAMEIQDEVKANSRGRVEFTTFEKLNYEKAEVLFYEDGNVSEAYKLLEPIYESHRNDEKILDLYLPVLEEADAEEAKEIIASIRTDEISAYLTAIRIAIKEKDLATAERKVLEAERIWPESSIVKCHKVLYRLALHKEFKSDEWLNKAAELVQNLGEATSRVELTWQVKVQCMVSEAMGEDTIEFDREVCKENQLFYGIMQNDPLLTFEEIVHMEKERQEKERLERERLEAERLAEDERKKEEYEEFLNLVEMVGVEGGTMVLGLDDEAHKAKLDSYYIGKYPVTQEEWCKIMGDNPSKFSGSMRPVERVTWYDAIEFCNKLSQKAGLECAYEMSDIERKYDEDTDYSHIIKATVEWNEGANGFRLPTCDEWEFAARGGNESCGYKYAGSDYVDNVAWYDDNSNGETHAVGQKKANELGIYDMSGNVWEWCWDAYGSGKLRYNCGGSYGSNDGCEVGSRYVYIADARVGSIGFRIVCSAD